MIKHFAKEYNYRCLIASILFRLVLNAQLCLYSLQEMELLDEDNQPLTHAKYHKEEMREAGQRDREPCHLEIPEYLEHSTREYLTQVGYPASSTLENQAV